MKPKKKFVVAITGIAKMPQGGDVGKDLQTYKTKINVITYMSPVLSCYDINEAVGIAIGFFNEKNPNHIVFQHVEQEI